SGSSLYSKTWAPMSMERVYTAVAVCVLSSFFRSKNCDVGILGCAQVLVDQAQRTVRLQAENLGGARVGHVNLHANVVPDANSTKRIAVRGKGDMGTGNMHLNLAGLSARRALCVKELAVAALDHEFRRLVALGIRHKDDGIGSVKIRKLLLGFFRQRIPV